MHASGGHSFTNLGMADRSRATGTIVTPGDGALDPADARGGVRPVEATAIGNMLVQARSLGFTSGDLETLRALVASTFPATRYEPR